MNQELLNKLHYAQIEILDEIDRISKKHSLQYFLTGGTLLGAVRHKGFIPWDDDLDISMPRKDYEQFIEIAKTELDDKFLIECNKYNDFYWLPFAKVKNKNTIMEERLLINYKGNKGIWVDIFPLDNAKKEKNIKQTINYKLIFSFRYMALQKMDIIENKTLIKKIINKFSKLFTIKFLSKRIEKRMTSNKNEKSNYFINYGSAYGIKKQTHPKEKYFPATKLEFEGKEYYVPKDYKYILTRIYGENYMELPPVEKRVTHNPILIKFEDGKEYTFKKE